MKKLQKKINELLVRVKGEINDILEGYSLVEQDDLENLVEDLKEAFENLEEKYEMVEGQIEKIHDYLDKDLSRVEADTPPFISQDL